MRYVTRFTLTVLFLGSFLILTTLLPNSGAKTQQQGRIIARKPWRVEPVRVVAAKTKNKARVDIDKAFDEDDDWMDGFTVTVINNYNKIVTALTIEMVFPREPGDTRPKFAQPLHFGPSPIGPEYVYRNPNKIIKIGKTGDIKIEPENYQSMRRFLQQLGYPNSIKRVELVIREVGFEDGSMLHTGTWYVQDPNNPADPTKKIRVEGRLAAPLTADKPSIRLQIPRNLS